MPSTAKILTALPATIQPLRMGAHANNFPDVLTGNLDKYRYFTVWTNPAYNQNSQVPINVFEGGQTVGFEPIYSVETDSPVYLNGSAQR